MTETHAAAAQEETETASNVTLLHDDNQEQWQIKCQPYSDRWRDQHRKEVKAPHNWLTQVAQEMVDQDITGPDKYRYAITAGYTHQEATTIAQLAEDLPPTPDAEQEKEDAPQQMTPSMSR